jgi:hypothetical protein
LEGLDGGVKNILIVGAATDFALIHTLESDEMIGTRIRN